MKKLLLLVVLIVSVTASNALATQVGDYYVGGQYNNIYSYVNGQRTVEGGGSITVSKLNGVAVPYDYCVDLFTVVYVPADYNRSLITRDGSIHNGPYVNNYQQVAWLLDTYGTKSVTDSNLQIALQAAIWEEINGFDKYHLDAEAYGSNSTIVKDYNEMLTGLANDPIGQVGNYYWITPIDQYGNQYQAQVAPGPAPVPEPSTFLLLGAGMAGLALWRRNRK